MHEMGIAEEIVNIAVSSIPADVVNPKIGKINLKIGKLSAVIPETLNLCFKAAAKDTPAENALLDIEEIPVTVECQDCGNKQTIQEPVFVCEKCKSKAVNIISGRELDIESLELTENTNDNK